MPNKTKGRVAVCDKLDKIGITYLKERPFWVVSQEIWDEYADWLESETSIIGNKQNHVKHHPEILYYKWIPLLLDSQVKDFV